MHFDWWTLALQTANVLILIWILARFFFRPVADIIAKRQEATSKLLADAAAARKEAADMRTEAEKAQAGIAAERDRLMAEARRAAQVEKADLLAQSSDEIAQLRSEAEAVIARQQKATERALVTRASELSIEIARRLVERLPPSVSLSAFVEGICRELNALPSVARKNLLATADADHPVEVVTAAPLTREEATRLREALHGALGVDLPLAFRSEPALIAGIELRGRNTVLRNNWQADLGRIREELNRDGHHCQP